ncbi:mechanosensitive ion channel [Francisella sp. Scap27]|uniref:mechanosensitive ion channel family protein n=1 Tax=Francisella sp. Scap27 TaxID=2589986 RepID=UPI0015BD5534|nr:mechanosensitive ion channel family protein [Francisella sp. Scap27]QLE79854.1 mechanosensitive ion channel [Francisella sp. Scap27]
MLKKKYHIFVKTTIKAIFLIICIFACYAYISPFVSAQYLTTKESKSKVYQSLDMLTPKKLADLNSKNPQNLFKGYYYKSLALWMGFHNYYFDLINSSYHEIVQPNDYTKNAQNLKIDKMLITLIQTDFKWSDIPEKVTGDELTLTLGNDNKHTFYLKKKSNGNWYFTERNFDSPETIKTMQQFLKQKNTRIDNIHTTSTPILSYINFIFGVNHVYGFNIEDSMETMITDWIPKEIRDDYSLFTAFSMLKVFEYSKTKVSSIPGGLEAGNDLVMVYRSPISTMSVYLSLLKDKHDDKYKWVFTEDAQKDAISILLYDLPNDMPRDSFTYNIRYTIWENIPIMLSKYGMNSYIVILALVSLILLYVSYKLIKLISRAILRTLGVFYFNYDKKSYKTISTAISLSISTYISSFLFFNGAIISLDIAYYFDFFFRISYGIIMMFLFIEIINLVCLFASNSYEKHMSEDKAARFSFALTIVNKIVNLVIILVVSGVIVQELGIDMVHFLTALGIGGIAIALAGKDTIENLFGSIMLAIERPIKIGDWVVVEDKEGTVEQIGLRSTTIRTFKDSALIIPNYTFINSKINNMGERTYRRYKTMVELEESTPAYLIKEYKNRLDDLVKSTEYMRQEKYHIRVNELTPVSVSILIYVFFISKDWGEELKQREDFIIKMLEIAEEIGIKFASTERVQFKPMDDSSK